MTSLPEKLPEAWSVVEVANGHVLLRKRVEHAPWVLATTAVLLLVQFAGLLAWWHLGRNPWVLHHRLQATLCFWMLTLITGYSAWASCWSAWGDELWRMESGRVYRVRSIWGYSWVRQFQSAGWEITFTAGSGNRHELRIAEAGKRVSLACDDFDDTVRRFGLALADVTGWPLQTR